jgi:Flp pilus assembly protein TadD
MRRCLELDPGKLDAMHGLIRALQEQKEFDAAIAVAKHLLELDPNEVLAHTSLSILYQHKGMVPEAEAEALKAKLLGWKQYLAQCKVTP